MLKKTFPTSRSALCTKCVQNVYMRNNEKLQYLMNTVEKKNKIKISNNDNNISGQNKKNTFYMTC